MQSQLTSCPACRKMISVDASVCPKCGKPFTAGELAAKAAAFEANWQKSKSSFLWVIGIIVGLVLLCGLLGKMSQ